MRSAIAAALPALLLSGCAAVHLPLCSAIAGMGGGGDRAKDHVNRYIREQAATRSIAISELSPFVAEYSGHLFNVPAFVEDYRNMLCAFPPGSAVLPASLFQSCMVHAPEWIEAVRGGAVDSLLWQPEYTYNCIDPLGRVTPTGAGES